MISPARYLAQVQDDAHIHARKVRIELATASARYHAIQCFALGIIFRLERGTASQSRFA